MRCAGKLIAKKKKNMAIAAATIDLMYHLLIFYFLKKKKNKENKENKEKDETN
jgi:hypothetical protein